MPTVDEVYKRMTKADSNVDENTFGAINAYRAKFGSVPTTFGINVPPSKMVQVLKQAVEEGKALSDDEWYKALGVAAPPKGAFI